MFAGQWESVSKRGRNTWNLALFVKFMCEIRGVLAGAPLIMAWPGLHSIQRSRKSRHCHPQVVGKTYSSPSRWCIGLEGHLHWASCCLSARTGGVPICHYFIVHFSVFAAAIWEVSYILTVSYSSAHCGICFAASGLFLKLLSWATSALAQDG